MQRDQEVEIEQLISENETLVSQMKKHLQEKTSEFESLASEN